MITYQDLVKCTKDSDKMKFIRQAINKHKTEPMYRDALIADEYAKGKNKTIMEFQKLLYEVDGSVAPDTYSANYKLRSKFFDIFITQENQYLLSNGATWVNEETSKALGKDFDTKLQEAGELALVDGVSFGYFNLDHLEVFAITEFVPIWDEEDGALKAGIRYWQIDATKPLRATLYELDGVTEYMWQDSENGQILEPKHAYKQKAVSTEADGTQVYDFENYPTFPIVPLYGNKYKQSELEGLREQIDCYDLIKSGFANTVDEASYIYWTLQNAGGMDEIDLAEFVQRMRTVHASVVNDNGARAESHSVEAPHASREALLDRLRADLFESAKAFDYKSISSGSTTQTHITAGYSLLKSKTDGYEYQILKFINGILAILGIEDKPTFTREQLVNAEDEIQVILQAADYLPSDYITRKILTLLGDGDQADAIIQQMIAEEIARVNYGHSAEGDGEPVGEAGEGTIETV